MALKDVDIGVKILGGLVAAGLAIALLSDGDPENDSWEEDGEADAAIADEPDDAWTEESPEGADGADGDGDGDGDASATGDDPWTRGSPAGGSDGDDGDGEGDGSPDPPPDDPWTRGSPADDGDAGDGNDDNDDGADDSDGGDTAPPADDPWTRGRPAPSGRRSLPPCVGTMVYRTAEGRVGLPTDRAEEAFASADCAIGPGRSGDAVSLVQVALNACNGQAVEVTAVHDEATSQALASVQSQHGLAADGVYGPATREAMAWPTEPDGGGPVACIPHPGVG